MSMRAIPLVILAVVTAVAAVACNLAGASVKGNGKPRTEQRTVPAFTGLSVSGAIEIDVTVGGAQSVELSGDDNVLPIIRTRVAKNTLVVDSKKGYSSKTPLRLRITVPSLAALSSSGACTGTIRGIAGAQFTIDASGASTFELTGTADRVALDVSGSGSIRARGLTAKDAAAAVSGSGEIELTATRQLAASVSGAAAIDYWGNPGTVARNISGAGSIESH